MSELASLRKQVLKFVKDRDWEQFHNPKDLAISLTLEAVEVLEHFQWKSEAEIKKYVRTNKKDISGELADVFYWVLLTASYLDIDIVEGFKKKMIENENKYPIEKSRGRHSKYTDLK